MTNGNPWPTPSQKLLLRAALSDGDVTAAWREWRRRGGDIGELDPDEQRVLPQLYRNLMAAGCDDPDRERLKGIYRHAWYHNQLLVHDAGSVLVALREAGIEAMVLKGAAVAALYPDGLGTRPMHEIDILLRPEAIDDGVRLLSRHGVGAEPRALARARRAKHAAALKGPDGLELDLHWEALWKVGSDAALWRAARPGLLGDAPVLVPGPADQLLHACLHGTGFTPAPMRWITDAMLVLRAAAGGLDWDHVVRAARDHRACRTVARALALLADDFGADVPPESLRQLARSPASPIERIESLVCASRWRPPGASHVAELDRYLGLRRRAGAPASFGGYIDHLADAMDLDGRGAVVAYGARRLRAMPAGRRRAPSDR
ncbi:MAG: nucleotidyltransferase family protein [Solirubrobacteraceae bacterium]